LCCKDTSFSANGKNFSSFLSQYVKELFCLSFIFFLNQNYQNFFFLFFSFF